MIVKIELFAMARELMGDSAIEVELNDGANVGDLKSALISRFPQASDLVARSAFSVNHEFAVDVCELPADAEIALIPPVSGG
ncbi:MAG: molybdopterin converting factor small subunit [Mariniblastus sp.]|jgi:molybdopterin converting factor small subunit